VVEVARTGMEQNKLTVETGVIRGQSTLRVRYPTNHVIYPESQSNSTVSVREDGTFNGDNGGDRGERVRISEHGSGLEAHADLTIAVPKGATVAVYVAVGEMTASNIDGHIRLDGGSGSINATSMRGELDVDVGSGEVTVNGMSGDLSIDTGSGDVKVTDVKGEDLKIDTGSGEVTLSNATDTTLKVDTGSGDVSLSSVRARDIELDTGSGRVSLGLLGDADRVKIDTGSGDVTLYLPDSFGAMVDIQPGSGGVESDVSIATRRWSSDHVTGTIGDGKGRMTIETGSGGVKIRKAGTAPALR
jgi:DUF4097 and DUF4098 domain-containing protein YvlB